MAIQPINGNRNATGKHSTERLPKFYDLMQYVTSQLGEILADNRDAIDQFKAQHKITNTAVELAR